MTYLEFLFIFLGGPIALSLVVWRRTAQYVPWIVLAALALMALLYTGPWDNAIIAAGVWTYPTRRVLGPAIGLVPIEEYAFYVLQVLLTGVVTTVLLTRWQQRSSGE